MDPMGVMAAAGLRARMESLDMLANNLANAATGGYKRDQEFYSLYAGPEAGDAGTMPVSNMPLVEKAWTDFSQGAIRVTDNPTDIALSGTGMLAVNGTAGPLYTRNGSLRISAGGVLVAAESHPVRAVGGGTLRLDSSKGFEIAADGTVRQAGQAIGQLEVAEFPKGAGLEKTGDNYFRAADQNVKPAQSTATEVQQGKLEDSNVATAHAAVRLVGVMRQFEMLQKAITMSGEMNRRAVEEVARV